jgi:hypothetical protein
VVQNVNLPKTQKDLSGHNVRRRRCALFPISARHAHRGITGTCRVA